jgi:hypothetical protein
MREINIFDVVFPVQGTRGLLQEEPPMLEVANIYGTAFALGGGCYMTAGHVIENAPRDVALGLGVQINGLWHTCHIMGQEVLGDQDIAIVTANVPGATALPWHLNELLLLTDVQSAGYPYALDMENFRVAVRAFKGYIVTQATFFRLAGQPRCYELSFLCPEGLSGAPVYTPDLKVCGVVIGTKATDMKVREFREETNEENRMVYERVDTLHFGVAIQTAALLDIRSELLGRTLRDHLQNANLL